VTSSANEGESYYKSDGEWKDFYHYDDPSGFLNSGNFCIKALTNDDPLVGIRQHGNCMPVQRHTASPNPFKHSITITLFEQETGDDLLRIFSIRGEEIRVMKTVYSSANGLSYLWDGKDNSGCKVSQGAYIYIFTNGRTSHTGKILYLPR
jgi:hypothetical protein